MLVHLGLVHIGPFGKTGRIVLYFYGPPARFEAWGEHHFHRLAIGIAQVQPLRAEALLKESLREVLKGRLSRSLSFEYRLGRGVCLFENPKPCVDLVLYQLAQSLRSRTWAEIELEPVVGCGDQIAERGIERNRPHICTSQRLGGW